MALLLICWLYEKVSLSSLNRHAVAKRADVGIPKAQCLKEHFSSIFPECHIEAKVLLYDASSEEEILSGRPDFVLDCIDNIDTKVPLLASCLCYYFLKPASHNTKNSWTWYRSLMENLLFLLFYICLWSAVEFHITWLPK